MGILKHTQLLLKSSIEFPCSYIKGNIEKRIYVSILYPNRRDKIVSEFTRNGFRRNYNHMYAPICKNCNSCIPSRINIKKFHFSKNYKRNLKDNSDLILIRNKLQNKERFDLFKNYCEKRHSEGQMKDMSRKDFLNFFHNAINQTEIYDLIDKNNKLYASILLDVLEDGFSAVYSFFNPSLKKRGLGKNCLYFKAVYYSLRDQGRSNCKKAFRMKGLFYFNK